MEPMVIDGGEGEGGGQILRSALSLALVTGRPFRIEGIRKRRSRPGLLRQHLTAVNAAAEVGGARVVGAALGSTELAFTPGRISHGDRRFAVGTAGSATLVLHTILPALLTHPGRSELVLEGGTENSAAPPFDHLEKVYLPLVRRMGGRVTATLERRGFYPAGGGLFRVVVEGGTPLSPIEVLERGALVRRDFVARVAGAVPEAVGKRELGTVHARLGTTREETRWEAVPSQGPGNTLEAILAYEHATEVLVAFGAKEKRSETVANELVNELLAFDAAGVPVSEHTADQLLLLLALAGGGRFRTVEPSSHTRTQAATIARFLDVDVAFEPLDGRAFEVRIAPKGAQATR